MYQNAEQTNWWNPKKTADSLSISTRTLLKLMKQGLIPYVRLNAKTIRFNPQAVHAAMQKLAA